MHDLSYFRNNFDRIAERLAARSNPPNLERFRELDRERRAARARLAGALDERHDAAAAAREVRALMFIERFAADVERRVAELED